MGRLGDISARIQEASATLLMLERAIAKRPQEATLIDNLISLRHVRDELETQFKEAAANEELDVCTYRVFSGRGRESARGFATSLALFQKLYSVVYDALSNGPKQRASLAKEITDQTDFGFAYSFSGSVAATLTLPNEHLLFDTVLDQTIEVVFEMAKSREVADVSNLVRRLGPAPISVLYEWADSNAGLQVGADIKWEHKSTLIDRLFMDQSEMATLTGILAQGSEPRIEEHNIFGRLEGIDVDTGTFKMVISKNETISGKLELDSAFDLDHPVEVPAMYHAQIRKTSRDIYSRGETEVRYVALNLRSAASGGPPSS